MRIIGLTSLLAGVIFMLLPFYVHYLPFVHFNVEQGRLVGGLFLALGAIALGFSRMSET